MAAQNVAQRPVLFSGAVVQVAEEQGEVRQGEVGKLRQPSRQGLSKWDGTRGRRLGVCHHSPYGDASGQ